MTVDVQLSSFDTPLDLYDQLARIFDEKTGGGHRWVSFKSDTGVSLTFWPVDIQEAE